MIPHGKGDRRSPYDLTHAHDCRNNASLNGLNALNDWNYLNVFSFSRRRN